MQDLGNAINESLSDSERIAEAIGEIKGAGYDVFLVLEATIGFNKREDGAGEDASESTTTTSQPQEQAAAQQLPTKGVSHDGSMRAISLTVLQLCFLGRRGVELMVNE